jgi:simple sugar transport system ATP-binding protein
VQRERVLDTIRRVRERGIAVVLISHNMPEVLAVADRVEVFRMGRRVAAYTAANTSVEELVGAMTGALEVHPDPLLNVPDGSAAEHPAGPDATVAGPDAPAASADGESGGAVKEKNPDNGGDKDGSGE